MELERLMGVLDEEQPRPDRVLAVVEDSRILEAFDCVLSRKDDISPEEETTLYSFCRCGLRIVVPLLQGALELKDHLYRLRCLETATELINVVTNTRPDVGNRLLFQKNFGRFGTAPDAGLYVGEHTQFPPSGAGKYTVGLITDCVQLGLYEMLD